MHETMRELEAGRELDALVAEKVMGWERRDYWCGSEKLSALFHPSRGFRTCVEDGPPEYSTVIAAAWEVLAHFLAKGWHVEVEGCEDWYSVRLWPKYHRNESAIGSDESFPVAVCRAALIAARHPAALSSAEVPDVR